MTEAQTLTVSDAAVQAALTEWFSIGTEGDCSNHAKDMRRALTAALPHLALSSAPCSVEVDVNVVMQPIDDIYVHDGFCDWADVATARDEIKRSLSQIVTKPVELLDEKSLQAKIFEIGNQIHNLGCENQSDEELSSRLQDLRDQLWGMAKDAAKPVDVAAVLNSAALIIEGRSTAVNSEFIESLSHRRNYEVAEIVAEHDLKLGASIRALSPAEPAQGERWQDIATAPRDGESILIWKPDERMVGEYLMSAYWRDNQVGFVPVGGHHKQGYYSDTAQCNQGYPTHWMPLPVAPLSAGRTTEGGEA